MTIVEEIQKLEWKPGENEKTVSMVITTEEKTDIREKLFYMMAEAKMPILNMQFTKVSLEDIFLELTQNETAPPPLQLPKIERNLKKSSFFLDKDDIMEADECVKG